MWLKQFMRSEKIASGPFNVLYGTIQMAQDNDEKQDEFPLSYFIFLILISMIFLDT